MNARLKRIKLGAFLAGALLAPGAAVLAADIKVMSDSPLEPALVKVVDLYRQQTSDQVSLVFDPSPEVAKRIEAGEKADVVIVQPDLAETLAKSGKVSAGDRKIIARVGVGVGNRSDAPLYDISTIEKFKAVLLGADLLAFNSVKSGQAFESALERLGIAGQLKPKIVRTTPNGIFQPVLQGKGNDLVAGTIPLIATTRGIKLLGPLPGNLQSPLTYTAALMANTGERDAAQRFIVFLASPEAKKAFAANGAQ